MIEENESPASTPKKQNFFLRELYDWGESICISLAIIMFLFSFCFKTVEVYGPSMEDTLHGRDMYSSETTSGDKLLISNLFYTPKYGDIVVLYAESEGESIIKRVIATEGQEVMIDFETGIVSVDGVELQEDYVKAPTYVQGDVTFPVTVGEGQVFVLGDNRPVSKDSRYSDIGLVDTDDIEGKVVLRIYPLNQFGVVD